MTQDDTAHTDARLRRAMDQVKQRGRRLRDFRTWPLFGVILVWVVLALVAFTALGWLWGDGGYWTWGRWLTNWRDVGAGTTPLDLLKVSLTTIGGIGGTGYLVIKYRERASAERAEVAAEKSEAEQRLLSAVQQLGSQSPQVRIAGVYSLADVADTYRGPYKQRVVDILCGYLRTKRGEWTTPSGATDGAADNVPAPTYVSDDGAVESTVLAVLGRHLRAGREATGSGQEVVQEVEDDQLWCDCAIDLHGAVLTERLNFDRTTFRNVTNFRRVTFVEHADFQRTTFIQDVDILEATFCRTVDFGGSYFARDAHFWHTTFRKEAHFRCAVFAQRAHFDGSTFAQDADFLSSIFQQSAYFDNSTFTQDVYFEGATFNVTHPGGTFPDSLPINGTTDLPCGAQWARFSEDGRILEIIKNDTPAPQEEAGPGDEEPPPSEPDPEAS